MNFENHYFTEEEQINEFLGLGWLAGHWKDFDPRNASNFVRKIAGSTKRKIQPQQYDTYEVSQKGFQNLFGRVTANYNNPKNKNKKFFVKDLFEGKFKDENAPEAFDEFEDVESTAVFRLNNGGAIILYHIKDDEGDDRYYVGIDGPGQKFFAAKEKQGGLGMIFKSWLSAQKAGNVWNLSDVIKGEQKKKKKVDVGVKHKIEIDREKFNDIAPEVDKIRRLAASNKSLNLLDIFNEEVLKEVKGLVIDGKKAVTIGSPKKGGKAGEWYRVDKNGNIIKGSAPIKKFTDDLIAVDKDGEPSDDLKNELEKEIEQYKEKKSGGEEKEPKKEDKVDNGEKPSKEQVDAYGKLYFDIKDELQTKPNEVKSKNVKNGWRYITNNNGTIFVYQSKVDDKYYIAYDDKGKNIVDKYDLINKYNLEKAAEAPE